MLRAGRGESIVSKLTTAKRKKIPKSEFGLPGEKKYPMEDKAHARNAKARASQMVNKGKLSESSKEKIDAKANRVLGKNK
jgi:hypothetical protein